MVGGLEGKKRAFKIHTMIFIFFLSLNMDLSPWRHHFTTRTIWHLLTFYRKRHFENCKSGSIKGGFLSTHGAYWMTVGYMSQFCYHLLKCFFFLYIKSVFSLRLIESWSLRDHKKKEKKKKLLPNSNEVKKIRQLKLHLLSAFNIKPPLLTTK